MVTVPLQASITQRVTVREPTKLSYISMEVAGVTVSITSLSPMIVTIAHLLIWGRVHLQSQIHGQINSLMGIGTSQEI